MDGACTSLWYGRDIFAIDADLGLRKEAESGDWA
jgi:hypothetical protein